MREIKFRGKRIDNGEWVYGYYINQYVGECNEATGAWEDVLRSFILKESHEDYSFENTHRVDPQTVGQYANIQDDDGNDLYEGNIVDGQAIACNGGFKYRGKVIFYKQNNVHGWHVEDEDGGAWELKQLATRISLDHITGRIVGNIHDNPELLEVSK